MFSYLALNKPSLQSETQMEHLAADYNLILADKVLVLKQYGHKFQQYWLIAMW